MSLISTLTGPVLGILDKFVEDKDQKAKLAHELATMADKHAQEQLLAQLAINKEEAKGNWFQSSWRPFIGCICGLSLTINYLVSPHMCRVWSNDTTSRHDSYDAAPTWDVGDRRDEKL